MSEKTLEDAAKAIINGDAAKAADLAKQGLGEGIEPLNLLEQGFVPGINEVGDLFSKGKLFIPMLIKSAAAMEKATEIINAAIPQEEEIVQGKVVLGTVQGDVHDIGKTIVVALFKANGFDVLDLGRDVANDKIIEEAEKFGADVIGTSTLLTTTMVLQKELEEQLKSAGLREKYKTIIGGAPVTQRWADRIGADAYAHDASDGVKKLKELLKK
ncbi:5-methyltetrahydrofolate--homocysteine methyltransferase (EC [Olavius algarvensis Delta 1 endosymbiont]|nr:5-methyltetrahydrofolate--homocysteine methyltransferase (EC [Olavius algarvensis Delta 1 endosymbiont]